MATSHDLLEKLKSLGAVWDYSGNPSDPHINLNGACVSRFLRYQALLTDPAAVKNFAAELIEKARLAEFDLAQVSRVMGSNDGPGTLAAQVALQLGVQVYNIETDAAVRGLKLLQVEEFVRNFRKGSAAKKKAYFANPEVQFVPFVLVLLHSPPECCEYLADGREIVPLSFWENTAWEHSGACPMCKEGSVRVSPEEIFSDQKA